jgi:hypothetical protein
MNNEGIIFLAPCCNPFFHLLRATRVRTVQHFSQKIKNNSKPNFIVSAHTEYSRRKNHLLDHSTNKTPQHYTLYGTKRAVRNVFHARSDHETRFFWLLFFKKSDKEKTEREKTYKGTCRLYIVDLSKAILALAKKLLKEPPLYPELESKISSRIFIRAVITLPTQ